MFGSIMPEPLAVPPTVNVPRAVCTVTACSFGNGSVVMIARAASLPWPRASAGTAARMPADTLSIGRPTPITPVEATSTSSARQPSAAATSAAMRRAFAMPSSPVQALAQPLLTTMARARPRSARDAALETEDRRGLRQVRREQRRRGHGPVGGEDREVERDADALMPACTAADVKPAGAVTPPAAGVMVKSTVDRIASAMQRGQRHARVPAPSEAMNDGVLAALPELRARVAVGHDLLRQPDVRHDREAQVHEVGGRVREGAQLLEAGGRRPRAAARRRACGRRRRCARRGPRRASALPPPSGSAAPARRRRRPCRPARATTKRLRVHDDLVALARQQVPFGEVLRRSASGWRPRRRR